MSEFIAEARVLVAPDTTKFRAQLQAQLTAINASIKPVSIPVVGVGQGAAAAATGQLTAAIDNLTIALNAQTAALTKNATAASQAAGAQQTLAATNRAAATASKEVQRGILAQTLGFAGLRGAVLGANTAFLLAATGALTFFKSLQLAATLEQDLATFQVTVEATADEMTRVADTARELGRDIRLPGVSASDAAESMLALAKAGLTVQDSIDGARGSLQLATAAEIDNAAAATLVANALNAFGLAGTQAVAVADLLANAANESQGSIEDMGIALRQSAAVANQVGLSAQDTVVFLTQLARAGLAGSDAGTTLRVALTRLVAPTAAARKQIEEFGLRLRDAQGDLRPDIFVQLGDALRGLNRAAQDQALKDIFGENAQRVAAILSRQGLPALRQTERALERQGTAAEVAAAKNEGLAGSVENAKNQFAAFALEIGQFVSPLAALGLDSAALLFGTLADQLHDTHEAWKQQIDDLEDLGGAIRDLSDKSGFTEFVEGVNEGGELLQGDFERAAEAVDRFARSLFGLGSGAGAAQPPVVDLTGVLVDYADGAERAGAATLALAGQIQNLGNVTKPAAATAQATLGLQIATARASGDEDSLLSLLREREENLEKFIKRQEARPQTKAVVATLTKANEDLETARAEIQAILERRATETERAARDAQSARDRADNAFLDMLEGKRDKRERFITQAEGTESLRDDILLRQRFIKLLEQQIENVRKTIRDAQLRVATIRALTAQIVQIGNEIKNLRAQQKAALKAAAQERQERIEQSIQLDIDFAATTGNARAEIAARERLISLLRRQIAKVKKGTLAWKELRNAIAEQNAAIAELKKEQSDGEDGRKSAAAFFFEQLQAQQGFAANLMGNLITGSTAGLVGNPAPAAQRPETGVRGQAAAAEGRANLGPTSGQAEKQSFILQKILLELRKLNGSYDAPEAIHQKKVGAASMDYTVE